jgi:hypothetical protein
VEPSPSVWESAVVVRVPSLEGTLAALRERFDLPRKPNGIPAHVTAIVPFLARVEIDEAVMTSLLEICGEIEPFEVTFPCTGRFPHVLYLEPDPGDVFVGLTEALARRWPQAQPYAGGHKEVIPHLTVTTGQSEAVFNAVAAEVTRVLPVTASLDAVQLYLFDGVRWVEERVLPLTRSGRGD